MNEAMQTTIGEATANPPLPPKPHIVDSNAAGFWQTHVRNNPMNLEATRTFRRFLAAHQKTASPKLIQFVLASVAALYVWMIGATLYFGEDISVMYLWIELIVLTLVAPTSVYAAISGERERLTWDSLIMTRLSPSRVLVGKLLWRVGMLATIMVLFFVPAIISHLFERKGHHDISLQALFQSQVQMGAWSLFLVAFGLLLSAKTKRAVTTLALTGGFLFTFLVLIPILYSAFGGRVDEPTPILFVLFGDSMASVGGSPYEALSSYRREMVSSELIMPVLGGGLVSLHPFLGLEWLRQGNFASTLNNTKDQLAYLGGNVQPVVFCTLAALCMAGTFKALRRLGFPTDGFGTDGVSNAAPTTKTVEKEA